MRRMIRVWHEHGERLTDEFAGRISEQQAGSAVREQDSAVLVDGDDRVPGGLGDDAVLRFGALTLQRLTDLTTQPGQDVGKLLVKGATVGAEKLHDPQNRIAQKNRERDA